MTSYGYGGGYTTTSYGAQGGADGGGFMAGGGSQANSQETPSKAYSKDSLRPVTIKQLIEAEHPHPDADFKVDGVDVTQITFIGQIRSISTQATNITYKLDDGTGTIEIKKWVDQDKAEAAGSSAYTEGQYLRVYGRLKEFSSKRHVGAHSIRPIVDYNEVTFHLLEASYVHLYFTQGPPETKTENQAGGNGGDSMFVEQTGNRSGMMSNSALFDKSMTQLAKKVLIELNTQVQNNEGLHVDQISRNLGMKSQDVLKGCDELLGMGKIYTTVDDNTFAVLDF